ncbi:MAG: hypothetical protein ACD_45C00078G0001 [uncultured bacterium]|nr:MAG: hypothetical protein ACD_45C00078G0001 [uncultured bacterium]
MAAARKNKRRFLTVNPHAEPDYSKEENPEEEASQEDNNCDGFKIRHSDSSNSIFSDTSSCGIFSTSTSTNSMSRSSSNDSLFLSSASNSPRMNRSERIVNMQSITDESYFKITLLEENESKLLCDSAEKKLAMDIQIEANCYSNTVKDGSDRIFHTKKENKTYRIYSLNQVILSQIKKYILQKLGDEFLNSPVWLTFANHFDELVKNVRDSEYKKTIFSVLQPDEYKEYLQSGSLPQDKIIHFEKVTCSLVFTMDEAANLSCINMIDQGEGFDRDILDTLNKKDKIVSKKQQDSEMCGGRGRGLIFISNYLNVLDGKVLISNIQDEYTQKIQGACICFRSPLKLKKLTAEELTLFGDQLGHDYTMIRLQKQGAIQKDLLASDSTADSERTIKKCKLDLHSSKR